MELSWLRRKSQLVIGSFIFRRRRSWSTTPPPSFLFLSLKCHAYESEVCRQNVFVVAGPVSQSVSPSVESKLIHFQHLFWQFIKYICHKIGHRLLTRPKPNNNNNNDECRCLLTVDCWLVTGDWSGQVQWLSLCWFSGKLQDLSRLIEMQGTKTKNLAVAVALVLLLELPCQICPCVLLFSMPALSFESKCSSAAAPKCPKASCKACKNLNKVILANGTTKNVMSLNMQPQPLLQALPQDKPSSSRSWAVCSAIDMRADAPLWSGHQRHIVHHSMRTLPRNAVPDRANSGPAAGHACGMTSSRPKTMAKPWKERFLSFTPAKTAPKTQSLTRRKATRRPTWPADGGRGMRIGGRGSGDGGRRTVARAVAAATLTDEFHK